MSAQRHIRRLRLTCVQEEHATHGRVLLEDAMRTASLGDEGRLVIVRRLNLGRLPARASATQWSRQLEQRYRGLRAPPVNAQHPEAAQAEAVYFASATEPWFLLAQRAATGRACDEWYWRIAVPEWKPSFSPAETLRLSFGRLARGGLALTLELALRLSERHALAPLLHALGPVDFEPLEASLGFSRVSRPGRSSVRGEPTAQNEFAIGAPKDEADVRTYWLAAGKLAESRRTSTSSTVLAAASAPEIRAFVQRWARDETVTSPTAAPNTARSAVVSAPGKAHGPDATNTGHRANEAARPGPVPAMETAQFPESAREFSRAGGLFFLLPLLVRIGLPEFAARLPEDEQAVLPWQVLRLALVHARIESGDPISRELAALPPARLPLGRWLLGANRQALRLTGSNLRQLVVRPALVRFSPTHVDVFFRVKDADIRIRRAGLDVNPGWLPWLGRAVAFHFNRED